MRRSFVFCLLLGLTACASAASSTGPAPSVAGPIASTPASTPTSTAGVSTTGVSTTGVSTTVPVRGTTAAPVDVAPLPDTVLNDPLVLFQADWLCQSSKAAYATAADIDSALGVRLASAGIDRAVYDPFVASLDHDNLTRAGVLQLFLQSCRP
jgi:hypothetical protein